MKSNKADCDACLAWQCLCRELRWRLLGPSKDDFAGFDMHVKVPNKQKVALTCVRTRSAEGWLSCRELRKKEAAAAKAAEAGPEAAAAIAQPDASGAKAEGAPWVVQCLTCC